MLHADSARHRLRGIGLISLTYVFFTLLDGSAKWLVATLPVLQVVWLRFATHALFSAAALLPRHGRALFRSRRPLLQGLRTLILLTMTALNFTALQYLQLSVTTSIFFVSPILVALISATVLREPLDFGRWCAILGGFAGVLVIVQPGADTFHPAMLLSVVNATLYALFNLVTRNLAAYDSPETTNVLSALGATVALAPFAFVAWQTPAGWAQWAVACLLGVFGGIGHHFLAVAHRHARASVLAPFLYPQVLYMSVFGYLVFGDVPGPNVIYGATIVIGSGLYLFHRERRGPA